MNDTEYNFLDKRKISEIGLTVISFVSLFLSIGIFILAAWIYLNPISKVNEEMVQNNSQLECVMLFNENGFSANRIGENISISKLDRENHKLSIIKFDSILARCKNYALNSFCYGLDGDCQNDGLNALLIYQKPFEYIKE